MAKMILGIGTDIIEVLRIKKVIERSGEKFLQKNFTAEEISYCLKFKVPYERFAARFAAKEAVAKALGVGFKNITPKDIEIINNENGRPSLKFSENFQQLYQNPHIQISISHCHEYATAVAIWQSN